MQSTLEEPPTRTALPTRPASRLHTRMADAGSLQGSGNSASSAPQVAVGAAELAEAIRVLASLGWLTVVADPDGRLSLRLAEDAS